MPEHKSPFRPSADVAQTYGDGVVTIYAVSDGAAAGRLPAPVLTRKVRLDYEELKKIVTFKAYPRTKESSTEIRELFEKGQVVFNGDEKVVKVVKDGLVRKHGFCPCRLPKLPEFFCPCDEFKGQLADPAYHGLCHCRLYLKP